MENISIGSTLGDFVTILTERSMQDIKVERSRVMFYSHCHTRKIVQCYCVHRVVYKQRVVYLWLCHCRTGKFLPPKNSITFPVCCSKIDKENCRRSLFKLVRVVVKGSEQ